jgi:sugar lactone lactonase YvrE
VANGEVIVYDPTGHQIDEVDVPERPIDLIFGGKDNKTLFILAHHALFAATAE